MSTHSRFNLDTLLLASIIYLDIFSAGSPAGGTRTKTTEGWRNQDFRVLLISQHFWGLIWHFHDLVKHVTIWRVRSLDTAGRQEENYWFGFVLEIRFLIPFNGFIIIFPIRCQFCEIHPQTHPFDLTCFHETIHQWHLFSWLWDSLFLVLDLQTLCLNRWQIEGIQHCLMSLQFHGGYVTRSGFGSGSLI